MVSSIIDSLKGLIMTNDERISLIQKQAAKAKRLLKGKKEHKENRSAHSIECAAINALVTAAILRGYKGDLLGLVNVVSGEVEKIRKMTKGKNSGN